jgi:diacylglycerol O-acyltransferase / wax synthase
MTPFEQREATMTTGDGGGFETYMSGSDSLLWTIERDPVLRSTITAVLVLDRAPDMDVVRERFAGALAEIPRLRQRVRRLPGIPSPRWTSDAEVDFNYHVRRLSLPPGSDLRDVFDLAAVLAMSGFDRARPLWEMTVVEGLPDGRAALIQKLHHSLADGEGSIRLGMMLFDLERDAVRPPAEGPPPLERLDPRSLAAEQARLGMRAATGAARAAAGATASLVGGLRNPVGLLRRSADTTRSVARMLAPVREPLSPVMRHRGLSWHFDAFDVDLPGLKRAGKAAGGTLNDAFIASVAGGLRRYHERAGKPVEGLRVTMPVSFRGQGSTEAGNKFAPARFTIPVALTDPAERVRAIGRLSRQWQAEPALPLTEVIAELLSRTPSPVATELFGSMLKGVDFVATNVAGMNIPVFLAGAEIERIYAFAPPSGSALSVAFLSHRGGACIGVVEDTSAVTDPRSLVECLQEGFAEVCALAG